MTALPVVATTALFRIAGPATVAEVTRVRAPYVQFLVYATANWATFAVIATIAGWPALRASGLRLRISTWRLVGAVGGFFAGVAIYAVVAAALQRWKLPPVAGMSYTDPTAVEIAILVFSNVLTAPLCEEAFFRVLWIGALRRHVAATIAIVTSVIAFATIHVPYFGIGGAIFIVAWSAVPITLFLLFEDWTAPVLMHVANNTFAYLVVPLLLRP